MTKKFVLGLELFEDQDKRRALKTVSTLSGIDEITIDMKGKKLTVVGTVDPITVVSKLRKKNWTANIISVGPKEEPKKEEPKKDEAKKDEAKKDESKKDEAKKEEESGAKKQSEEGNKKESESPANNKKSDDHHQQAVNIRVIEPPQFMYGGAPPMPAYRPYYYQQPMHMNPNPNSNFYYVKHHSMEENPNACVIC